MKLAIAYLYASGMNVYGDRGNVVTLVQRCRWRGFEVEVVERGVGESGSLDRFDLIFAGGGQDRDQVAVSKDLQGDTGRALREAIEADSVVMTVCGTYQLLGHYFKTGSGETLPGIGVFDAYTVAGNRRWIGDTLVRCESGRRHRGMEERVGKGDPPDHLSRPSPPSRGGDALTSDEPIELVGFENHSGRTYLNPGCRPLGRAIVGAGNNGEDGTEGAAYRNAFGTYLHGPLLPKNPRFADHLIRLALRRRGADSLALAPLPDDLERIAHDRIVARVHQRGRVRSGVR